MHRHATINPTPSCTDLVGLGRFELPTSPLSGVRSNQLSYRPSFACLFHRWTALQCSPAWSCAMHTPGDRLCLRLASSEESCANARN